MIEGAAEWAVFMDPQVFGEPVTYVAAGQPPVATTAIFTAAHGEVARAGGGVATTLPVLVIAATALPFTPQAGDQVTVRAQAWRVADPQPDGSGLIRLILERN